MSSNAAGHDNVVSKEVQDVLAPQTPVQAEPWLVPRMAPSASGAKVSITSRVRRGIAEASPRGRLPDERSSRSVGRIR